MVVIVAVVVAVAMVVAMVVAVAMVVGKSYAGCVGHLEGGTFCIHQTDRPVTQPDGQDISFGAGDGKRGRV